MEHAARYRTLFQTYPTVRICRDLLVQYVFERPFVGPPELDQDYYRLFGIDAFDQVMQIGFVIISAKPNKLPVVVPWEMCRISVELDENFKRKMKVYSSRAQDQGPAMPLPHVYVLDIFGHSPSLDGTINPLLRPLAYSIELVRDQMDCAMAADRARARPPCYTEVHADATAPAQEVTYDYYADATSVQQSSMNTYMRNQSALEQLEAQQQQLRTAPVTGEGRERVAAHNVSVAVKNAINSMGPMPLGQQVARGPECHAPDQLVDRMRFIEQEVFVLLGVPRSFCMHDITVRHDAGMLHCTMTRTVQAWQRGLSEAITFAYNVCNNGPPKKRKRVDVERFAKDRDQSIQFEAMPRVSVPELSLAYDKGVITWEAFQRQMATFCGMQPNDLTAPREPWTQEERFAMMGGNKLHVSDPSTEFKKSSHGHGL